MTAPEALKKHLQSGRVYRRGDLAKWSNAVDRHLQVLQKEGFLQKVGAGMYYVPESSVFGIVPPGDRMLVERYLKDSRFLITSPNDYNMLGVGTTQLYNKTIVYNHKRHGEVKLGNRMFSFWKTHFFPDKVTLEFLLVDLVNNRDRLAEDMPRVLSRVIEKAKSMDQSSLRHAVEAYGSVFTRNFFSPLFANF